MPISPPHATPNTLATVLDNARAYSIAQFNAAFAGANIEPPEPASTEAPAQEREDAKAAIAAYEKAQRAMAAAIQQIANIDQQAGQAKGYEAVANLMVQTSDTATKICKRIQSLMGGETAPAVDSAARDEIDSLAKALAALAALSPAAPWQSADEANDSKAGG